jgi:hypothetical protein
LRIPREPPIPRFFCLNFGPGRNAGELEFAWLSKSAAKAVVRIAKASDRTGVVDSSSYVYRVGDPQLGAASTGPMTLEAATKRLGWRGRFVVAAERRLSDGRLSRALSAVYYPTGGA